MRYFEQAQENLKRSNFYKALELFQLSLREDALSDELKVFCCEKIEKINKILGQDTTVELLEFLANHYFELTMFQKSQEFFGKLFDETKEISYLKKQFESLHSSGDVVGSLRKSNEFLELLYKRRLSDEIQNFIYQNRTLFKVTEYNSWAMRSFILSGDIRGLEKEVSSWNDLKVPEQQELFQELLELTGHDAKYWHSSEELLKTFWKRINDKDLSFILTKKRVIKLTLDYWLSVAKDQDLLRETIEVAQRYKLPIVGHNIAKYVGDFELGETFLGFMPRSAFQDQSYDFGEDLFGETDQNLENKLERDIKFLLKTNKKSDVLKLTYQLEKINPSHPLVASILKTENENTVLVDEKRVDDLLKEIEKYSLGQEKQDDVTGSFLGIVKHYEDSFVQENYEDMVIGFNLVNLPTVALAIIEKVEVESLSERKLANLRYLEIETNLLCGNNYRARDISEDTLATVPLIENERVAFTYLRAECYFQLGNYSYAKQLFKGIAKKTPNYRLTEQRILRLEENQ